MQSSSRISVAPRNLDIGTRNVLVNISMVRLIITVINTNKERLCLAFL